MVGDSRPCWLRFPRYRTTGSTLTGHLHAELQPLHGHRLFRRRGPDHRPVWTAYRRNNRYRQAERCASAASASGRHWARRELGNGCAESCRARFPTLAALTTSLLLPLADLHAPRAARLAAIPRPFSAAWPTDNDTVTAKIAVCSERFGRSDLAALGGRRTSTANPFSGAMGRDRWRDRRTPACLDCAIGALSAAVN